MQRIEAGGAPVEFVRFAAGGLLSNQRAFGSDLVLVTADSMSMLAEAIAARRPAGILFADDYRPPKRDAVEQAALVANRRAFRLRFSGLVAEALISGAADLRVLQGSELDALYDTLARHGI